MTGARQLGGRSLTSGEARSPVPPFLCFLLRGQQTAAEAAFSNVNHAFFCLEKKGARPKPGLGRSRASLSLSDGQKKNKVTLPKNAHRAPTSRTKRRTPSPPSSSVWAASSVTVVHCSRDGCLGDKPESLLTRCGYTTASHLVGREVGHKERLC